MKKTVSRPLLYDVLFDRSHILTDRTYYGTHCIRCAKVVTYPFIGVCSGCFNLLLDDAVEKIVDSFK